MNLSERLARAAAPQPAVTTSEPTSWVESLEPAALSAPWDSVVSHEAIPDVGAPTWHAPQDWSSGPDIAGAPVVDSAPEPLVAPSTPDSAVPWSSAGWDTPQSWSSAAQPSAGEAHAASNTWSDQDWSTGDTTASGGTARELDPWSSWSFDGSDAAASEPEFFEPTPVPDPTLPMWQGPAAALPIEMPLELQIKYGLAGSSPTNDPFPPAPTQTPNPTWPAAENLTTSPLSPPAVPPPPGPDPTWAAWPTTPAVENDPPVWDTPAQPAATTPEPSPWGQAPSAFEPGPAPTPHAWPTWDQPPAAAEVPPAWTPAPAETWERHAADGAWAPDAGAQPTTAADPFVAWDQPIASAAAPAVPTTWPEPPQPAWDASAWSPSSEPLSDIDPGALLRNDPHQDQFESLRPTTIPDAAPEPEIPQIYGESSDRPEPKPGPRWLKWARGVGKGKKRRRETGSLPDRNCPSCGGEARVDIYDPWRGLLHMSCDSCFKMWQEVEMPEIPSLGSGS